MKKGGTLAAGYSEIADGLSDKSKSEQAPKWLTSSGDTTRAFQKSAESFPAGSPARKFLEAYAADNENIRKVLSQTIGK